MEKTKLNLGCGRDVIPDYLNVDFMKEEGVDIAFDLDSFPYPLEDNQFEFIKFHNVFCYLNDFLKVMNELHRISKNRCLIDILVPHFSGSNSFYSYTKTFFRWKSFDDSDFDLKRRYVARKFTVKKRKLIFYDSRKRSFKSKLPVYNKLFEYIFNKIPLAYEQSFLRSFFPAQHIHYVLEVKK